VVVLVTGVVAAEAAGADVSPVYSTQADRIASVETVSSAWRVWRAKEGMAIPFQKQSE
jgi:hypothetical protein